MLELSNLNQYEHEIIYVYMYGTAWNVSEKKMFPFTVEKLGFTFKIKAAHYCLKPTDNDNKVQVYNYKMVL